MRPPRFVVLAAVVLAVGAAVLMPRGDAARRQPGDVVVEYGNFSRWTVDDLVDLADLGHEDIPGRRPDGTRRPTTDPDTRILGIERIAGELGSDAPATLVAAIIERGRRRNPGESSWRAPEFDDRFYPLAVALRSRSDAASDEALLRAVVHPAVHFEAKLEALVVLCRSADPVADRDRITSLAALVTDLRADVDVRHEAVLRLDRLGGPLPPEFHAALDDPSTRIAQPMATVLSHDGEIASIELLIAEIEQTPSLGLTSRQRGVAALSVLREHPLFPLDLEPTIAAFTSFANSKTLGPGTEADRAAGRVVATNLAEALKSWMSALPNADVPAWDREMRALRRSPERQRALALTSEEALADAADDDIDVAGATLCVLYGSEGAANTLDRLDRLARRIRPSVDAAPTPLAKLQAIQDACVPRRQTLGRGQDHSSLAVVLESRSAICVGWTMLFVALGDRLGLPIRAVHVPGHVFVRWDDGRDRFNFDPSFGGVVRSDAEVAAKHGGPDDPLDAARDLRPMSRRELVSVALSNSAGWGLSVDAPAFARRLSDLSARLDPANSAAWINGLAAIAIKGPAAADEMREHLRRAAPVRAAADARVAGQLLVRGGLGDEALRMLDAARRLNPAQTEPPSLRATALAQAGNLSEARDAARAGLKQHGADQAVCQIVWLALDIVESSPPIRVPEGRLKSMFDTAAGKNGSREADAARPWLRDPDYVPPEREIAERLGHLLLTIPPRTPDRARLALDVLDAAWRYETPRFTALGLGEKPFRVAGRYEALRRYAEDRAAEAAPSTNPGAPVSDK